VLAAAVLASLAGAIPAQANTATSCGLNPVNRPGIGVQLSIANVTSPTPNDFIWTNGGGPLTPQKGTYVFDPVTSPGSTPLHLLCSTTTGALQTAVFEVDVTSDGNFENWACGSGAAWDPAAKVGAPVALVGVPPPLPGTVGYSLLFAGGQGVLSFNGGITGHGAVSIQPTVQGIDNARATNNANNCTNQFMIEPVGAGTFPSTP
jgi:hypothetical protein